MLRKDTQERIKILIKDTVGNPITGLVETDFKASSIYLYKSTGAKTTILLTLATNFFELDSVDSPGVYEFVLSVTDTNTLGPLSVSFQPDTAAFAGTYYFDEVSSSTGATVADVNAARDSIKGISNLSISDLGGSIYNPLTDNLHEIKVAINSITMGIAGAVWDELTASHISAGTYGEFVSILSAIFLNRIKIDYTNKTLIVYQADNVTPLKTYSLFDQFLNPATINATERSAGS